MSVQTDPVQIKPVPTRSSITTGRCARSSPRLPKPPTLPHKLLDGLMERLPIKTDAELHLLLGVPWLTIRKIRQRRLTVSVGMLVHMHMHLNSASGLELRQLKALLVASE